MQKQHDKTTEDLKAIFSHVQQIKEKSIKLQAAYAGDKAKEIADLEKEILQAWNDLKRRKQATSQHIYKKTLNVWFRISDQLRLIKKWFEKMQPKITYFERDILDLPLDMKMIKELMNAHEEFKVEATEVYGQLEEIVKKCDNEHLQCQILEVQWLKLLLGKAANRYEEYLEGYQNHLKYW